ncbi:hypothetical protein ACRALDRAFT_211284 [Sodiomyces alcalophilus JCM 7366]|uniref:uncharacterized protein n=1 Tax=Sodiomyces alcalophilus JCM 7366 TaxID=591952 RepID=UPI0039B430A7
MPRFTRGESKFGATVSCRSAAIKHPSALRITVSALNRLHGICTQYGTWIMPSPTPHRYPAPLIGSNSCPDDVEVNSSTCIVRSILKGVVELVEALISIIGANIVLLYFLHNLGLEIKHRPGYSCTKSQGSMSSGAAVSTDLGRETCFQAGQDMLNDGYLLSSIVIYGNPIENTL